MTDADLASIGVLLGHRKKILKAVNDAATTAAEETPDRVGAAIGQRRQVTVLFADLTGYTRLSTRPDPEEAHKLLNNFFAAVDAVVENYAGRVHEHIAVSVD